MNIKKIKTQENVGFGLIVIGIVGFFTSMSFFGLFGKEIVFTEILPEILIPFTFLLIGICGIGYAAGGKKGAVTAASLFAFVMFVAVTFRVVMNAIQGSI